MNGTTSPRKPLSEEQLIKRMRRLANTTKAEDLSNLSRLNGVSDLDRGAGGGKGGPSFTPPPEYSAIEALEDLRIALDNGEIGEAMKMYFYLKRVANL